MAAPPRLSFSSDRITAEGLTPGGDAIWMIVSISEFNGSPALFHRYEVIPDTDRDGRVELPIKVKRSSVCAVVDFVTGEFTVLMPDGRRPPELAERENGWKGGRPHADFNISELHVLVVRPNGGAWKVRIQQGGPRDGDRRPDNNLRVKLDEMQRIHGTSNPPPVSLPHDLMIAVDPIDLLTFVRAAGQHP